MLCIIKKLLPILVCTLSFNLLAQETLNTKSTARKIENQQYKASAPAMGGGGGGVPSVPRTPTSAPHLIDGYHPINASYSITFPPYSSEYYKLYESTNNSSYSQVYSGTNFIATRSQSSYGYRYYKYKKCNAWGCSGYSPYSRLYVYKKPNRPASFKASPVTIKVNGRIKLTWAVPGYMISTGSYYQIKEIRPNGSSSTFSKLTNKATTSKYIYPKSGQGLYKYQIKACNETSSFCSSVASTSITLLNTSPVAVNNTLTVAEDSGLKSVNVISNDSDADSDALTIISVSDASHGTTSKSGHYVRYKPAKDFFGSDSFTYSISDGHGGSATATVNVTVSAVLDAPVIAQGSSTVISTSEDVSKSLTLSATDVDSSILTWSMVSNPSHGSTSISGTGTSKSMSYKPAANYYGTDSFKVRVSDGGLTDTITVNVTVASVNDNPLFSGSPLNIAEVGIHYNFTPSSSDIDGDTLIFTIDNKPSWTVFDTNNGSLTGVAALGDVGVYDNIIISTTDGVSTKSIPAFFIEVKKEKHIIYLHTDLLGSPVLETDRNGDIL